MKIAEIKKEGKMYKIFITPEKHKCFECKKSIQEGLIHRDISKEVILNKKIIDRYCINCGLSKLDLKIYSLIKLKDELLGLQN